MTYTPPSVRYGNRRAKLNWWFKGRREAIALRLAPWLTPRRPEPRPVPPPSPPTTVYDRMCDNWGTDPEKWPSWFCSCGQRHAGWSLFCERCNTERNATCPQFSTHGGSDWADGTYTIGGRYEIVCGSCGAVFKCRGYYIPAWVPERTL